MSRVYNIAPVLSPRYKLRSRSKRDMKLKRIKLSIEDVMNNLSGIEKKMAVNLSHLKLCPIRTSTPKKRLLTFKKYRHRCTPGSRYSTYFARESAEETELLGDRDTGANEMTNESIDDLFDEKDESTGRKESMYITLAKGLFAILLLHLIFLLLLLALE